LGEHPDRKQPLRETILQHLIEDIRTGRLGDGERLSEVHLARRFEVSRTPIREALVQLEKLGFVVLQKNVGGVVRKMTPQGVREIFEIIATLEGQAVESCGVRGLGPDDWAGLDDLQQRLTALAADRQFQAYFDLNHNFHAFFTEKCGNQALHEMVRQQRERVYRIVSRGSTIPVRIDLYLDMHRDVIQALRDGKPEAAGRLMKAHVQEAGVFVAREMARN
jgi:DNA-binding GntR family transcriptional regulator